MHSNNQYVIPIVGKEAFVEAYVSNQAPCEHFELFRRAVADHDDCAWTDIYVRYRGLLASWAHRAMARYPINEHYEDVVDQAFARAWLALRSEQFGRFQNLPSLLSYVRSCVTSTVIDLARSQITHTHAELNINHSASSTPEQAVLDELERQSIWQTVMAVANSEQERTVLLESFVLGLPPRQIYHNHQDMFDSVAAVYRTKRNVIERLQHNPMVSAYVLADEQA